MRDNSEQNWVERAKQGEPAAIGELYRHYWRAARAAAYGMTGDLNLAEDAASEALYDALDNLQTLKDSQRFGPWLHTIATRTAIRLKTSRLKGKETELQTQSKTQTSTPSDELEQKELATLIHEAVETLSEILREAISLFYFEGYSIEDASRFLDIPTGTFKRRLHDGRLGLRDIIEHILKGKKPMNSKREQLLQQLNDFVGKEGDSEAFRTIMYQVFRLRPLPYELISKLVQQRSKVAKKILTREGRDEVEQRLHKIMTSIYQPSSRSLDSNHSVGKVASIIRATLPEFKEWQVNISLSVQNLIQRFSGDLSQSYLPPGYAQGIPGSYIYAAKGALIKTGNDSFCTLYESMQNKNRKPMNDAEYISNGHLSDMLVLMWMRQDTIELREVEELLWQLSKVVVPNVPTHFSAYEEPHYRSALRMQIGDTLIPSAIGGPLNSWPNIPENINIAHIQIFLEPWAINQNGETIELMELSSLMGTFRNKTD